MLNWVGFLQQHHVDYAIGGKNEIVIPCPFCGVQDPSKHMSIAIDGRGWKCWRDKEKHSGRSPIRLIQALARCSYEQARRIAGIRTTHIPDDFMSRITAAIATASDSNKGCTLVMPQEFREFRNVPMARPYRAYMNARGYPNPEAISTMYGLRWCDDGPFGGRVIFPVLADGRLVSWTGRAINPQNPIRYKTLTTDPERARNERTPLAVGPITNYLLWRDMLGQSGADTIFLCEGPFDALRVNVLGARRGVHATCLFTNSPSRAQVDLLHELLPRFSKRYILLDQDAWPIALRLEQSLSSLNVKALRLPDGIKDPGELSTLEGLHI